MELLGVSEVAALTGLPAGTLRYWRSAGLGPASFKIGRRVVYRRESVDQWISEQEKATVRGGVA